MWTFDSSRQPAVAANPAHRVGPTASVTGEPTGAHARPSCETWPVKVPPLRASLSQHGAATAAAPACDLLPRPSSMRADRRAPPRGMSSSATLRAPSAADSRSMIPAFGSRLPTSDAATLATTSPSPVISRQANWKLSAGSPPSPMSRPEPHTVKTPSAQCAPLPDRCGWPMNRACQPPGSTPPVRNATEVPAHAAPRALPAAAR